MGPCRGIEPKDNPVPTSLSRYYIYVVRPFPVPPENPEEWVFLGVQPPFEPLLGPPSSLLGPESLLPLLGTAFAFHPLGILRGHHDTLHATGRPGMGTGTEPLQYPLQLLCAPVRPEDEGRPGGQSRGEGLG